jgi:hypothetical protein
MRTQSFLSLNPSPLHSLLLSSLTTPKKTTLYPSYTFLVTASLHILISIYLSFTFTLRLVLALLICHSGYDSLEVRHVTAHLISLNALPEQIELTERARRTSVDCSIEALNEPGSWCCFLLRSGFSINGLETADWFREKTPSSPSWSSTDRFFPFSLIQECKGDLFEDDDWTARLEGFEWGGRFRFGPARGFGWDGGLWSRRLGGRLERRLLNEIAGRGGIRFEGGWGSSFWRSGIFVRAWVSCKRESNKDVSESFLRLGEEEES